MQLGLARAVAAHGIEVHAGLHHGRMRMLARVLSAVRVVTMSAAHGLRHAGANRHLQARAVEVGHQLAVKWRRYQTGAQRGDAHQALKRQGLELALRAVADERHHPAIRPRQGACGRRHGGGAQGRGVGEFTEQQRHARHIGQHAKGHHGGIRAACCGWPLTYLKV